MIGTTGWQGFWVAMAGHLWAAGLVILALAMIDRLLLANGPARFRVMLWTLCLAVLCVPATWFSAALADLWGRFAPPPTLEVPAPTVLRSVLQPEVLTIGVARDLPAWPWPTVTLLWLLGSLVLVGFLSRRGRADTLAVTTVEPVMGKRLARSAARAGVPERRIVTVDDPCVPHARGVARPRIVIASELIAELSTEELAAVLAHEAEHLRRHDPARRLAYRLILTVFWFFPLTWLVLRRLHRATELACDEAVLRAGFAPDVYVRAIARTLRRSADWSTVATVALAHPGGAELRLRLDAIRRGGKETRMKRIVGALGLSCALLVAVVATAAPAPLVIQQGVPDVKAPPTADGQQSGGVVRMRKIPPGGDGFERLLGLRGVGRELDLNIQASVRDILLRLARHGGFAVRFEELPPDNDAVIELTMTETTVGQALVHVARAAGLQYDVASRRDLVVRAAPTGVPDGRAVVRKRSGESGQPVDASPEWSPTGERIEFEGRGGRYVYRPDRDDTAVRIGGDIQAPERTHYEPPRYPAAARRARLEGVVILEARVDRQGNVTEANVLRGLGLGLDEAAAEAVRQWKYTPTRHDGRPVEVLLTVTVGYELSGG